MSASTTQRRSQRWIARMPLRVVAVTLATAAAFVAYRQAAVPIIEPALSGRRLAVRAAPDARDALDAGQREELSQWFQASDWELEAPKILESPRGRLLFDKYESLGKGLVRLNRLAIVIFDEKAPTEEERRRKAIVLRAPDGATMQFEGAFEPLRAKVGKFQTGQLHGRVTVRSDNNEPGPDDDLWIETRDVDLTATQLTTPNAVRMRLGPNHGGGRDLRIEFVPSTDGKSKYGPEISGIKGFYLGRDVHFHALADNGALRRATGRGGPDETPSPKRRGAKSDEQAFEITSRGAMRFDEPKRVCSFEDQVVVKRLQPDGRHDELRCQWAAVHFLAGAKEKKAILPKMTAQSIEARGKPLIFRSPAEDLEGRCQLLEHEIASKRISLRSEAGEVEIRRGQDEVHARELHYEPGLDGRIGRLLAVGPGWLLGTTPENGKDEPRRFEIRWERELRSRPHEGEQVVSIEGRAYVDAPQAGRIAADAIHAWLEERPKPPPGEGPALERSGGVLDTITPKRLLADGNVRFATAPLTGKTPKLEVWFDGAGEPSDAAMLPLHTSPPVDGAMAALALSPSMSPTDARANSTSRPVLNGGPRWNGGPVRFVAMRPPSGGARLASGRSNGPMRMLPGAPPRAAPVVAPRAVDWERDFAPGAVESENGPPNQQFEVYGDLIRVQAKIVDRRPDLSEVVIEGRARFTEVSAPEPGQQPMAVEGDRLHVVRVAEQAARLAVAGQPALVEGRGMTLQGNEVHLDQAENRAWINGAGTMRLVTDRELAQDGLAVEPGQAPQPIEVAWDQGMEFDGRRATFTGHVVGSRQHQSVRTEALSVVLDRTLDFTRPKAEQRPQIAEIVCRGDTLLAGRTYDERGLLSMEQIEAADVRVNQTTGDLFASGPGAVTQVRRGAPPEDLGAPVGGAQPGGTRPPIARPAASRPGAAADREGLNYLFVRFQGDITGNTLKRQVTFADDVRVVYGPVPSWESRIDADGSQELGERQMLLNCEALTITQRSPAPKGEKQFVELEAAGNALVEGNNFVAQGDKLRYDQAKDMIVLEGRGKVPAQIWRRQRPDAEPGHVSAGRIRFWRQSNQAEFDDIRLLDSGQLPKKPK